MKNNYSFFSPSRLVFRGETPGKAAGSAEKVKPGVDTKAARAEFLKNARAKIDAMKDSNPHKEELNTMWLHCHMAETFSKQKAQDHAMDLMQRLGETSGSKALERKAIQARREIQTQRKMAYNRVKNQVERRLQDAYVFDKPTQWSVNGKIYETVYRKNGTFWTKEVQA